MESTARGFVWANVAAVAAGGAMIVYGPPDSWLTWMLLTALHVVLLRALPAAALAAWLPLVALAVGQGPGTNLGAVALAALGGIVFGGRPARNSLQRIEASVAPLVLAGAVTSVASLQVPPAFSLAGGAAVGVAMFVISGSGNRRDGLGRLLEMTAGGAVAAGLGLLTAFAGPWLAPLAAAGLMVAASGAFARREVDEAEAAAVASLLRAVEVKDLHTRGHCERVAAYAEMIGVELGFHPARLHTLRSAATLHDIGKVVLPRRLLRKRDRLDAAEYQVIQTHTAATASLLDGIEFLAPAVPIILEHHRHVDGRGYGAVSDDGPSLDARIVAVADAFDAMTTHRRYRRALTPAYALAELRRCAGTQFDADVVEAFVAALERTAFVPPAVGVESDTAARLAALGVSEIPEVIGARL